MIKKIAQPLIPLMIGVIGIVYGDIGTSPLYAVRACFSLYNLEVSSLNILGITSLVFWSLCIVVFFKYMNLILRADHRGEGGILVLSVLCSKFKNKNINKIAISFGIIGTALFYGDGVLTPAISVLSALEGLSIVSPIFEKYIPIMAIIILYVLFWTQSKGTKKIGSLFGPLMILWFLVLAILGAVQILQNYKILAALNPYYGIKFFIENGILGFLTLGSVVLVLTGAEALYADMGHFNRASIRNSWYYFVFPALILNYFGQGALLLNHPEAIENPFYRMAPVWGLYPLIILSTLATVIASQSIISGIFSMSWQAIQLSYFPRMKVIHTSSKQIGQVYVPVINKIMFIATVISVLFFQSSGKLATAYGISVTGIMFITSILTVIFAFYKWQWSLFKVLIVFSPLIIIDLAFLSANFLKFSDGGWFPLMIALIVYALITTWKRGRQVIISESLSSTLKLDTFIDSMGENSLNKIPGTAIFMSRSAGTVPSALLIHLKYNKILHEKIIFLSIVIENTPKVLRKHRLQVKSLNQNIYKVTAHYGFNQVPDLNIIFERMKDAGIDMDLSESFFILSKGLPVASQSTQLSGWREKLFIFLSHNAMDITDFFRIPNERVLELGVRFKI
jgi:KUP system potassium uptake protein